MHECLHIRTFNFPKENRKHIQVFGFRGTLDTLVVFVKQELELLANEETSLLIDIRDGVEPAIYEQISKETVIGHCIAGKKVFYGYCGGHCKSLFMRFESAIDY